MSSNALWRPQLIEGWRGAQPALTPTVVVDAARRAPSAPSHAHNGRFKDEDGAVVSYLVPGLGVAPDATRTKGRGAKKHFYSQLRPRGLPFGPATISTVALGHP
jgi:hypothetical protein